MGAAAEVFDTPLFLVTGALRAAAFLVTVAFRGTAFFAEAGARLTAAFLALASVVLRALIAGFLFRLAEDVLVVFFFVVAILTSSHFTIVNQLCRSGICPCTIPKN